MERVLLVFRRAKAKTEIERLTGLELVVRKIWHFGIVESLCRMSVYVLEHVVDSVVVEYSRAETCQASTFVAEGVKWFRYVG